MVQPGFPISLPVFLLALALAHDIVVLLGYHFDSALLIFSFFTRNPQKTTQAQTG